MEGRQTSFSIFHVATPLPRDVLLLDTNDPLPTGIKHPLMTTYVNYLPDEILLEVLAYIEAWDTREKQATLARFCAVNRSVLLSSNLLFSHIL
jgi:hypothetical protein